MTENSAKDFVRDARRASGAVLDPGKSITLIIKGNEAFYAFSEHLVEQNVNRFLQKRGIIVHVESERRTFLFGFLLLGLLLLTIAVNLY